MWEAKTDFAEVFLLPRAVPSEKALAYGVYVFFSVFKPCSLWRRTLWNTKVYINIQNM